MVDEFFGVAGYHHPAKGQGHNLGDLFWSEDFSLSLGIFVGTPIVVRDFVVGRPEGRQVLDTVELEVGLLVSVFEFFKVAW